MAERTRIRKYLDVNFERGAHLLNPSDDGKITRFFVTAYGEAGRIALDFNVEPPKIIVSHNTLPNDEAFEFEDESRARSAFWNTDWASVLVATAKHHQVGGGLEDDELRIHAEAAEVDQLMNCFCPGCEQAHAYWNMRNAIEFYDEREALTKLGHEIIKVNGGITGCGSAGPVAGRRSVTFARHEFELMPEGCGSSKNQEMVNAGNEAIMASEVLVRLRERSDALVLVGSSK